VIIALFQSLERDSAAHPRTQNAEKCGVFWTDHRIRLAERITLSEQESDRRRTRWGAGCDLQSSAMKSNHRGAADAWRA
jgi:hypothetical protein